MQRMRVLVDLDKTLATYTVWKGHGVIGAPIGPMVDRVRMHLARGDEVAIFTARMDEPLPEARAAVVATVQRWLRQEAGLPELEVTNVKDKLANLIYDDRAIQVEPNTGRLIGEPRC